MARRPVVFDCDGVLIDSEDLSWSAWRRCAEIHGIELSDEDVKDLTGRRAIDIYGVLADRGSLPPAEQFLASLEAMTRSLFEESLTTFEDAEDTAEHLRRIGFRLAVASSSSRVRLEMSLKVTGLAGLFEAVVSGDDVEHGKPSPDIYLAAAESLGAEPSVCTAVEDAPAGIESAAAAGMRVVAVDRGLFPATDLGGAHLVVPRLTPAAFLG